MEFYDVVRKRHMVRSFDGRPLGPGLAEGILATGLRGPTAGFTQAVDLVALEGPAQTARYWDAALPGPSRAAFPWPGLLRAPLLVVVVCSEAAYRRRYAEPDKVSAAFDVPWWHVDAAFAGLLLLLAAVDADLGALFFQTHRPDQVLSALGVPMSYVPVGTVAVGYPDGDRPSSSVASRARRPDAERLHPGGW